MRTMPYNKMPGTPWGGSEMLLKRRTDADAEYTEDGRDERIGATEYAEGNGTWKRGGNAECTM